MFSYRIGTEMMDEPPAIKHLGLIFKKDLNLFQLMLSQILWLPWKWAGMGHNWEFPF